MEGGWRSIPLACARFKRNESKVECNFCSLVKMKSPARTIAARAHCKVLAKLQNEFCKSSAKEREEKERGRVGREQIHIGNVINMDEMPEKSKRNETYQQNYARILELSAWAGRFRCSSSSRQRESLAAEKPRMIYSTYAEYTY